MEESVIATKSYRGIPIILRGEKTECGKVLRLIAVEDV
jgi:hypothetical protein